MIVDSSALVAVLRGEPEADEFKRLLADNVPTASAVTALETAIVVTAGRHRELDELLTASEIAIVPFGPDHVRIAREAYTVFGKGSGSRAQLNFGDCMAYALAKVSGEPLLFKGDDFTHTDVTPAR